jgi:hypothetical protein
MRLFLDGLMSTLREPARLIALLTVVAACGGVERKFAETDGGGLGGGSGMDGSAGSKADSSLGPDVSRGDSSVDGDARAGGCMSGVPCAPAKCQIGVTVCTDAGPTCVSTGAEVNGTDCDVGSVCKDGVCAKCADGMACGDAGMCKKQTIVCSTGLPVCTVGANLPNGTSCGMNLYCNEGMCAACTNGAKCVPAANPCNNGTVSCQNGALTCTDAGTHAPDGTACGTDKVCNKGVCSACAAGMQCNPSGNLCQLGTTSCDTGTSVCANPANVTDGTPCGTNKVCNAGTCVMCATGAACNPNNNPCLTGVVACRTGSPVCTQTGQLGDGTSCGNNQVCKGGQCGACTAGATCNPGGNPCQTGTASCASGTTTCANVSNVTNGTSCGNNLVCSNGSCVPCTAAAACHPNGNACQDGTTSCSTGQAVCNFTGNVNNGTGCGNNQVCYQGSCGACMSGVACNPGGNSCQNGTTSCGSGQQTCTFTSNVNNGTSCGNNQVCYQGNCVACTANAACNPSGNVCQNGTTSCSTGQSVCGFTGNVGNGTGCGTNQVCYQGNCAACTANAACNPNGNVCQDGSTSCSTGQSVCGFTGNVGNGTGCGTNKVCYQGNCATCTANTACNPNGNVCQNGSTSCSTGQSVCGFTGNVGNGTGCGTNQVCYQGNCMACTAGNSCNPNGNMCQNGTTSCSTGQQTCNFASNATNGTSCTGGHCCGGGCTDTTSNNSACGTTCRVCPGGSTCASSQCTIKYGYPTKFNPCGTQVTSINANLLLAQKVTLTSATTITALGVFGNAPSGVQGVLALYSDAGGVPSALQTYTNSATIVAGDNRLPVLSSVTLQPNTYWIAGEYNAGASICTQDPPPGMGQNNPVAYVTVPSYPTIPNAFGSATSTMSVTFNYYVAGTL